MMPMAQQRMNRVRERRLAHGLSQAELAAQAGLSRAAVAASKLSGSCRQSLPHWHWRGCSAARWKSYSPPRIRANRPGPGCRNVSLAATGRLVSRIGCCCIRRKVWDAYPLSRRTRKCRYAARQQARQPGHDSRDRFLRSGGEFYGGRLHPGNRWKNAGFAPHQSRCPRVAWEGPGPRRRSSFLNRQASGRQHSHGAGTSGSRLSRGPRLRLGRGHLHPCRRRRWYHCRRCRLQRCAG